MEKPNCRFYEFGDFRLDLQERVLLKDKEEIPLTGKVFDLLLYLVQNEGRTLEHDEILEAVWPDSFVEQANLKKGVSTLRKLLGEQPDESRYIKTIPRRGYRFVAEVKPVLEDVKVVVVATRRQYEEIIEEEIIEDDDETGEPKRINAISDNNFYGRAALPAANTQTIDAVTTKKNIKVYLFAVAACLAVLVLSAAFIYRFAFASKQKPPSIENLTLSKLSNSGDVLFSHVTPDGHAVIYGTMDERGDRALWVRRVGNKASVIQLMPPSQVYFWGWSISPDGEYVYYVIARRDANYGTLYRIPLFGGKPETVIDFVNGCGGLSPDGKRILVIRWKNEPPLVELISVNAENGSDEKLIGTKPNAPNFIVPQWSHDGKKVLYVSNDTKSDQGGWSIIEKTIDGGGERRIISSRKGRIWGIALSKNNGDGFIMNAVDPETNLAQLYYVSYPNGEEHRLTNDLSFYFGVSVSDDGKTISAAQRHFENDIWVITDGKVDEAKKVTRESNIEGFISWTPDDRIVYAAPENNRLHVWVVNSDGSNSQQLTPNDSIDRDPAVSPDGRFLVFLSRRTGVYRLWRMDMDGRNPKILFDGVEEIVSPQVTPDGKHILFAISNMGKYVLAQVSSEGGEIKRLTNGTIDMFSLSPDGRQIAYSKYNEQTKKFQIEVIPYQSEGETKTFDISSRDVLTWTPDGKNLLFKYVDTKQFDPATIWQQPVSGGAPKPFMKLKQEYIIDMAFSKDGKKFAAVGSRLITDAVLLQQK